MDAPRRRRALSALAALLALLPWGCTEPGAPPSPPSSPPPSVLLITLDTTRTDRLGCYGSKAGLTPFLDGLAARSTLFERCYSPVPLTLPSHTSILSGWLPARHGVRVNVAGGVPGAVPVLAEAFQRRGYATGAFVSASVLLRRYGLDRGFDVYDDSFYDRRSKGYQKASADLTLPKALGWLQGQRGPFFCWVHLFDPHRPYAGLGPFASRFPGRPYDAEVAYMDAQLAAFWADLSRTVDTQDLVVVVCADHGEALGERGEEEHGIFLYENTTRVPLFVHLPGQGEPRRVAGPVGLVDIAPTLRELAHLDLSAPSDGASLAPLLRGGTRQPRPLFLESLEGMAYFGWAPLHAVVQGREKFIRAPRPELYDLAADPGETVNLSTRDPGRAAALGALLQQARDAVPEATAKPTQALDGEELRQLASLGYLGGAPLSAPTSGRDPKDGITQRKPLLDTIALLGERRFPEALAHLQPVAQNDPKNPYLHFLLGQAYRSSDPARAVAEWKRAVALAPAFSLAWVEWVTFLLDSGRTGDAADIAALGLKCCDDRSGALHTAMAAGALVAGDRGDAVSAHASAALAVNPDLPQAHLLRAEAHRRAGRAQEALADYQAALSLARPGDEARWSKDAVFGPILRALPEMDVGAQGPP